MQKDMGAMMKDMSAMMSSTTDPSMKERMQKMHDQMGAMMGNMQKMGGGMMGGGMMQGGQNSDSAPSTYASRFLRRSQCSSYSAMTFSRERRDTMTKSGPLPYLPAMFVTCMLFQVSTWLA